MGPVRFRTQLIVLVAVVSVEALPEGIARPPQVGSSKESENECLQTTAKLLNISIDRCAEISGIMLVPLPGELYTFQQVPVNKRIGIAYPNNASAQSLAYDVFIEMRLCQLRRIFSNGSPDVDCVANATEALGLTRAETRTLLKLTLLNGRNLWGGNISHEIATAFSDDPKKQQAAVSFPDQRWACEFIRRLRGCGQAAFAASGLSIEDVKAVKRAAKGVKAPRERARLAFPNDTDKIKRYLEFWEKNDYCIVDRWLKDDRKQDGCRWRSLKSSNMEGYARLLFKKNVEYIDTHELYLGRNRSDVIAELAFPTDETLRRKVVDYYRLIDECVMQQRAVGQHPA